MHQFCPCRPTLFFFSQTSPSHVSGAPGRTFVSTPSSSPSPSLSPSPTPRARSPSPRNLDCLGVNVGQRVRRLSSPGREEERGGETLGGERRGERRRQAQLLQLHRELQNVEVILRVCVCVVVSCSVSNSLFPYSQISLPFFSCLSPSIRAFTPNVFVAVQSNSEC